LPLADEGLDGEGSLRNGKLAFEFPDSGVGGIEFCLDLEVLGAGLLDASFAEGVRALAILVIPNARDGELPQAAGGRVHSGSSLFAHGAFLSAMALVPMAYSAGVQSMTTQG
jgi:hypothetical protein